MNTNIEGRRRTLDERGSVMLAVLLITMAVGAMAISSVVLFGNASRIEAYASKEARMEDAADAGLELGRAYLASNPRVYPDEGFVLLPEAAHPLRDASGAGLTGLSRRVYVGPSGVTTGQYGVFGSVVSVVEDPVGNRVVRRLEMAQESFAKYAYFTDDEGGNIYFAPGDRIYGPLHSNDELKIMQDPGGPTFFGEVTTAETVWDPGRHASFRQGLQEEVEPIPLPTTAELSRLRSYAASGGTAFQGDNGGGEGQATSRIEFIAIDLNGDDDTTDPDEGFFRFYRARNSSGARWVVADAPSDLEDSRNCGHVESALNPHRPGEFVPAADHDGGWDYNHHRNRWEWEGGVGHSPAEALRSSTSRCYLGGSEVLTNGFDPSTPRGDWVSYTGGWATPMPGPVAARADADYLHPLSRAFNPNFKGVIHVEGRVAVSGVLRGRVTLAATSDIVIADDVLYANHPAGGSCTDILGLFAGSDVIVADNTLNTPHDPGSGSWYRTYDDTPEEIIHGVILALQRFEVRHYNLGPTSAEPCESTSAGRGCLYVVGGIIQRQRGAVGTSSGSGYIKRYSYDQCGADQPPPYFPTTGRFTRGRYYEVDPIEFDIARYWDRISAGE